MAFYSNKQKAGDEMERQNVTQLVTEAKENPQVMLKVICLMKPLIKSYCKRTFFLDKEDAIQEVILAIIESVKRIPHCSSDGECINYIRNAVKINYAHLCKKNDTLQFDADTNNYENNVQYTEKYADIEFAVDIHNFISTLPKKKKELMILLVLGASDQDIARRLNVSRQYVNRIKKQIIKKM